LIGTSIALLAVPMLVGAALSLVAVTGLLRPPARGYCENGSLAWPGGGPVPGGTSRRCSDACGLPRAEVGLRPRDDVGSRQPVVAPLPVLA
jgi:hypothetical protein